MKWFWSICREADGLLGALLRASYCHNARVVIVGDSTTQRTWLHDFVPACLVLDVSQLKPLVWSGDLWLVSAYMAFQTLWSQ